MIYLNVHNKIKNVEKFEKAFAEFVGADYAVAVSSGTMADTIALAVLKYLHRRTEVFLPALTFIAQANSVFYNDLDHVFYDEGERVFIEAKSLCFFPVQLMGRCSPIPMLGVPIIEDACEALGSSFNGRRAGTFGDIGTFSFYNSHALALGEGGMIVTHNKDYADLARTLRNHGSRGGAMTDKFKFDMIGFNGKMMDSVAVEGLKKLKGLQKNIERRNEVYLYLGGEQREGEFVVPHGLPIFCENRDAKMQELEKAGIESRRMFSSIPTEERAYEFLGYQYGDFPRAEQISAHYLYVPCHENLTDKQVEKIKKTICA